MPTGKEIADAVLKVLQPVLGRLGDRLKALEDRPAPRALTESDVRAVLEAALDEQTLEVPVKAIEELVAAAIAKIQLPKSEPGRDALQIEILPSIDPARSYARGTFASYRGGIVRAARTTDYLDELKDGETIETKGWQIIVAGLAEQSVEQVNERTWLLRSVDTAGRKVEKRLELPVLIYRGVWRDGDYQRGDTCTWGGSLWHCEEPTNEKPGTGKGWKLAVKRGADAKPVVAHADR
jgi:hypothetical protein